MAPWSVTLAALLAGNPSAVEALERGDLANRQGDLAAARKHFAEAARLSPDLGLAQLELGIVEQRLEPTGDAARRALLRAAELLPDNPRAQYHRGLDAELRREHTAAIAAFEQCLRLRSGFRDAELRLALAYEGNGQVDEAVGRLRKILAVDGSHTGAVAALARIYEAQGLLADAERALLTMTKLLPHVAYQHAQLAGFYERTGQHGKARRALAQADAVAGGAKKSMRPLKPSAK